MISGKILNKYLNTSESKSTKHFNPYQDDWFYQDAYSKVKDLPKELPDDMFEDLLTAACYASSGLELYPYAASKPDATDEERVEHLTEPKLHPNQMELLLEEVHDQFDHQANKPEERDIVREMCEDLLTLHDKKQAESSDVKYIDPPEGWKYGFPKLLPTGETDIYAWLVKEGYPRSLIEEFGDAFIYRILGSLE
jgi:hypothetical protein